MQVGAIKRHPRVADACFALQIWPKAFVQHATWRCQQAPYACRRRAPCSPHLAEERQSDMQPGAVKRLTQIADACSALRERE